MGDLVLERFRVLERIGSGGMGTVYRALDERLQRHVAVKELAAAGSERVLREAQAAARLNHPAIVTLYEYGTEDGRALLVSELVAGATLDELTRAGALTDRDVAEIGANLADALAHAHDRGVVHRDLKPQNVIVGRDDGGGRRAKLMDFGIASLVDGPTLTASGEVLGTLAYMAPEQAEGDVTGPAADTYSLALTLYECWAGENPIRCATPAETVRAIGDGPPSLRALRPDLPPDLLEVVDACLDPDPELRPSLPDLAATLEHEAPWLEGSPPMPALGTEPAATPGWTGVIAAAATVLFAPPLGALSAGAAVPALAGAVAGTTLTRLMLGSAGWCSMLAVTTALGLPPDLGIAGSGASGAAALAEPASLAGAAVFGLGALAFGVITRARHVALALLGALLWAAALTGALELVADGTLADSPPLVAACGLGAVIVVYAGREPRPRRAPRAAHHEGVAARA